MFWLLFGLGLALVACGAIVFVGKRYPERPPYLEYSVFTPEPPKRARR